MNRKLTGEEIRQLREAGLLDRGRVEKRAFGSIDKEKMPPEALAVYLQSQEIARKKTEESKGKNN